MSKYNSLWWSVPSCSSLTFIVLSGKRLATFLFPIHMTIWSLCFFLLPAIYFLSLHRGQGSRLRQVHCPKSFNVLINVQSALSTFFLNIKVVEVYCCFLGVRILHLRFTYHRVGVGNMAIFFSQDHKLQSYDSFHVSFQDLFCQFLSSTAEQRHHWHSKYFISKSYRFWNDMRVSNWFLGELSLFKLKRDIRAVNRKKKWFIVTSSLSQYLIISYYLCFISAL